MDRCDYFDKIQSVLSDQTKFKPLNKNPIPQLKTKINSIITASNSTADSIKLDKIVGDYTPGYLYGNIKNHKPNNPIRPIISQVTTLTYNLSKRLNEIITPFIPNNYMLKSTSDFIDLLQSKNNHGIIASLDVLWRINEQNTLCIETTSKT